MVAIPSVPVALTLLVFVCASGLSDLVQAEQSSYSFESVSNTLGDGNKRITELTESSTNSVSRSMAAGRQNPNKRPVESSRFYPFGGIHSNDILGHQEEVFSRRKSSFSAFDSQLGAKNSGSRDQTNMMQQFMSLLASHGGARRGFMARPRAVESPALSVDSGGRSRAQQHLANSISKILRIEQGHYADIYDRIDHREPL